MHKNKIQTANYPIYIDYDLIAFENYIKAKTPQYSTNATQSKPLRNAHIQTLLTSK